MHRSVNHSKAGAAFTNILGQLVGITHTGQGRPQIRQDALALAAPHMMKEFAPAKLKRKLVSEFKFRKSLEQFGN